MPQIEVENLSKQYFVAERRPGVLGAMAGLAHRKRRVVNALNGVSFSIEPGELVAYIGPNGAGKSTTVKILSGILVPTSGACTVAGRTPWRQRIAHVANIGVVFGQRSQLWRDLPVCESFDLLRAIYRVEPARHQKTRDELVELLDLASLLDTPVRQLSLGQRMRCELAAALLHEPDILFLDEPTIGLDALGKLAVRRFIRELNARRNVTVILTTHDMDDIEAVCDRVMVVGRGQLLSDGSLDELRKQVSNERRLVVDFEDPGVAASDPQATLVKCVEGRATYSFNPSHVAPAELINRLTSKYAVRDLFVEHPPIEQMIADLYAKHGIDPEPDASKAQS